MRTRQRLRRTSPTSYMGAREAHLDEFRRSVLPKCQSITPSDAPYGVRADGLGKLSSLSSTRYSLLRTTSRSSTECSTGR